MASVQHALMMCVLAVLGWLNESPLYMKWHCWHWPHVSFPDGQSWRNVTDGEVWSAGSGIHTVSTIYVYMSMNNSINRMFFIFYVLFIPANTQWRWLMRAANPSADSLFFAEILDDVIGPGAESFVPQVCGMDWFFGCCSSLIPVCQNKYFLSSEVW